MQQVHQFLITSLLLVVLGVPLATEAHSATPAAAKPAATGDFAGLVDIGGGRRLWLECRGEGSPTVILEAGYRSPANVWTDDLLQPDDPRTMVLEGAAGFTRVCAYERPGAAGVIDGELQPSRSDPVPMPRTAESVFADLHALLEAGFPLLTSSSVIPSAVSSSVFTRRPIPTRSQDWCWSMPGQNASRMS